MLHLNPVPMKILILGAGAVGGYFGGLLARSGADVTFFVRPGRKQQIEDCGLRIDDRGRVEVIDGVQTLVGPPQRGERFDLIVLACKSYGLTGALQAIDPILDSNPTAAILPLLNGMAHLGILRERYPNSRDLWGGTCGVVATLTSDGTIKKMTESQFITVGALPNIPTDTCKMEVFVDLLRAAGINAIKSDTILQKMWEKWAHLATLGAATCLFDAPIGEILTATDAGESYIKGVFDECHQVAVKELGDEIPIEFLQRFLGDRQSIVRSSMARDMQQGNPTEADHILGDMIQRAQQHHISTPLMSLAYARLQIHEHRRRLATTTTAHG